MYNRPAGFEVLLDIAGLRFALAHIGWPWCDEMIAVYGKFLSAKRRRDDMTAEMFIDLTPGTPPIYRREALTKLLTVGYDITHNLIFGTDCNTNDYNVEKAREWIARDTEIYRELDVSDEDIANIFSGNFQRFLGISNK
jgi:predicted TIM-barrel fold metal-dependent hydrolase